jgi:hypothetical protein
MRPHNIVIEENFGHFSINTGVFDKLPRRVRFNPSIFFRITDVNDGFGRLELRWIFMILLLLSTIVDGVLIFAFLIVEETGSSNDKDMAVMLFISSVFFIISEYVGFVLADDFFDLQDQEQLDTLMVSAEKRFREYLMFNIMALIMDIMFHSFLLAGFTFQTQIVSIFPLLFYLIGGLLLAEKINSLSKTEGRYKKEGYFLGFLLSLFTGFLSLIMQILVIYNK